MEIYQPALLCPKKRDGGLTKKKKREGIPFLCETVESGGKV